MEKDKSVMEKEKKEYMNTKPEDQTPESLYSTRHGDDITVRDDLHDFSILLDAVKVARGKGSRFRLIDTGKLDGSQLEWLAKAGADVYTSSEARADITELELVNKACITGRATCAYFHHGPFDTEKESGSFSYSSLQDLGRSGIYLHLTNRQEERDGIRLDELAYACRRGGSWLVYYHYGLLELSLDELARNGAWIHATEQIFRDSEDHALVLDKVRSAVSAGLRFVLHVEKGLDFSLLHDVMSSGAYILFAASLFKDKSPLSMLAKKVRQKKLNFRAYYLYPNIMP
jgi:hypothetical protein